MSKFSPDNRDVNEEAILEIARACGYVSFDDVVKYGTAISYRGFWQQGTRMDGHDLRFYDLNGHFIVEVKNDTMPPSKRKLTPREETMRDICYALNIPWYVVETEDQALAIFNGRR